MEFMRNLNNKKGNLAIIDLGFDDWDGIYGILQYKMFQYNNASLIQINNNKD